VCTTCAVPRRSRSRRRITAESRKTAPPVRGRWEPGLRITVRISKLRFITCTRGNTTSNMSKKRLCHSPRVRRVFCLRKMRVERWEPGKSSFHQFSQLVVGLCPLRQNCATFTTSRVKSSASVPNAPPISNANGTNSSVGFELPSGQQLPARPSRCASSGRFSIRKCGI
jgi:hypothetical protein